MESGAVCRQLRQISSLAMRRASAWRLPIAYFAKEASSATRGICSVLSNRELQLLEPLLSHRKQTMAHHSNRGLSTIAKTPPDALN
jgi:hypothetical protein